MHWYSLSNILWLHRAGILKLPSGPHPEQSFHILLWTLNWCIISICFSWKPEERRFSFMHTWKWPAQAVHVSFTLYTCKSQAIIYTDYIMRQSVSFQNGPSAQTGHTCITTESHLAHKSHAQERLLFMPGRESAFPQSWLYNDCSHLLWARPKHYILYRTFSPQTSKEEQWERTTVSLAGYILCCRIVFIAKKVL